MLTLTARRRDGVLEGHIVMRTGYANESQASMAVWRLTPVEWVSDRPQDFSFVTRDLRLVDEASRAGFRVHVSSDSRN